MTEVQIDDHGRPEPPLEGDEAATLLGFLDFQRATLEWKCRGLSDEQLRVTLPPTSMTLGGMLKHLACVEDYWCTEVAAGEPTPEPWASVDWKADHDWEWHTAAGDSGDDLRGLWAERVGRSRAVVSGQLGQGGEQALAQAHPAWGGQGRVSLRWVLVHLIEEYARHNGHADLIRESIDGETGE
ncbi:MAG TPA: DinB family protein [Streptosporangiaceae bacterium]